MTEKIKKAIKNVSINYEDGTRDELKYYALAGFGENTWFHVMYSPGERDAKVRLNNLLVELSNDVLER
jgi:hypothetical protein